MSLNRTIDRLARAIKREAARNPGFAAKLDAVLAAHTSRRADDDAREAADAAEAAVAAAAAMAPPDINPIALVSADGADALAAALASDVWTADALRALANEHNLDPADELAEADKTDAMAHIVAAALRRVERDRKLFDY